MQFPQERLEASKAKTQLKKFATVEVGPHPTFARQDCKNVSGSTFDADFIRMLRNKFYVS
jgi:hypothetical protein